MDRAHASGDPGTVLLIAQAKTCRTRIWPSIATDDIMEPGINNLKFLDTHENPSHQDTELSPALADSGLGCAAGVDLASFLKGPSRRC
jgi:hypothetical protein